MLCIIHKFPISKSINIWHYLVFRDCLKGRTYIVAVDLKIPCWNCGKHWGIWFIITHNSCKMWSFYIKYRTNICSSLSSERVRPSTIIRHCLSLFPLVPTFMLYISYYSLCYSSVCFFIFFHPCCSHTRAILSGIRTLSMGSSFPAVHLVDCPLLFEGN